MDITLIYFVSGLVFGGACATLAANKNRDPLGWFALGFFFSLVALIVIAALSANPASEGRAKRGSHKSKSVNGFAQNPTDPERPWLG
jgi:hypothetical protein